MNSYVFDNSAPQAGQRFTSLEALYDQVTFRHLAATGVGVGWRCLEVGAGGGSVARWLAHRAGPMGHVLATDINPRWIPPPDIPWLHVSHHDIVRDPLPESEFGVIHARLVLIHIPQRESVLRQLAAALRPGGWLVIEDFDLQLNASQSYDGELISKYRRAMTAVLAERGVDPAYARTLPQLLAEAGLDSVHAEGHIAFSRGGSPGAELHRANAEQTRDELVATGMISSADIGKLCEVLTDPATRFMQSVLVSASGRRPESGT